MLTMVRRLTSVAFFILSIYIKSATSACSSSTVQLDAYDTVVTTFTSEDYPNGYPSLQGCSWLITASGAPRVLLYIPEFYLEENYDFLYIYNGNSSSSTSLWVGTGSYTYEFFLSSSDTMYLSFFSDYSVSRTGFKIQAMGFYRDNIPAPYSCGDTLTAFSGNYSQLSVILDYDSHHRSACAYTITSGAGTNIQFSLQIDKRGGIIVYDGANSSVSNIVSYRGNGDTNTYQSSDNNIYIQKTTPYAEFVLVYREVSTSATTPTAATTTTTISPVYACSTSEVYASSTVEILESPGYPNPYSNNLYCLTTIEAQDTTKSVTVTITDVELPTCCDTFEIFDGYSTDFPLVWSGDRSIVEVNSTGAALTVLFSSDSSGALRGFQLQYQQIAREIPSCVPTNVTYLNASTSEQGFYSPNYPSNYDNNDAKYWLITKTDSDVNMVLDILDIEIEYSVDCIYDRLTIYDGPCTTSPVLVEVCGSNDPVIEDSTGLYILVEFVTDSSVTYPGWKILYQMGEYEGDAEEEGTWPWWILLYVVPAVVVVIFLFCVFCRTYYKRWQASKQRVTPTGKGAVTMIANTPAQQKPPKRLTTSQLLAELQARYGDREMNKKHKISRKHQEAYGMGNGVQRHPGPPPPYGAAPYGGGAAGDPAYPPNFFEISANEVAAHAPKPNMAPQSQLPPLLTPTAPPMETRSIPGPSRYVTPAEARAGGTISDPREIRKVIEMTR